MLTSDTKRHIDAARQVLVGIVPDPKGQVDQITNALIYKFMDDMDQASLRVKGGKASFFTGDLEQYAWTQLMDPKRGNQDRMNLYVEALNKFGTAKQLPPLFRDIFKRAVLPYRNPETLGLFLKEIAYFDYSHSEELGNAYEYLLSIMGSQGDAGQFRTPRHIIDFIVAAVDPTKDDTVLDPACGTAGFLISAYKHILAKHDGKDESGRPNTEIPLTPDERKRLMEHFEGFDISPDMVRMSQVNMYLHAFKNPKISEYNTLSSEDRWNDKFDVILANPPFMSPKGGVRPHQRFSVESTRAEVLFVDYIMNHLKPRGRAGIIVPEGIIFQSGTAYKQLRKNLVDDGLCAVVSLPAGVFNPYSGVKTSILLFDRELAKRSTELLFVKVQNDGYDLGAQRREHAHDDLPQALEILHKWRAGKKSENALALYVEKAKVAETGDYNLSADRYRVGTDYSNAKWPMVKVEEIVSTITPPDKLPKERYGDKGSFPIIDQSQDEIAGWTNDKDILVNSEKPLVIFGDHTCTVKYVDTPFAQGADGIKILLTNDLLEPRFFYYVLKTNPIESDGYQRHFSKLKRHEIPLPPLEIQQQIVAELDGYAGIIAGAKQVVENWKPKIDIDPAWEKVKLGDVCDTSSGGTPLKSEKGYYEGGKIPWLRSGEVAQGFITESELFITEEGLKNSSAKLFPMNTVLVAMYGATAGQVGLLKFESSTNQAVCGVLPNEKFIPEFLFQALRDQKERMVQLAGGGAQPNISQGIVRGLEIPLPPLEVQRKIVEQIESERTLVDSAKKLITIYEQKTKDTIARLWGNK